MADLRPDNTLSHGDVARRAIQGVPCRKHGLLVWSRGDRTRLTVNAAERGLVPGLSNVEPRANACATPGRQETAMRVLRLLTLLLLGCSAALAQLGPTAATDQPQPVAPAQASDLERAAAPYVRTARSSYPAARAKFLAGLPQGQTFYIVIRLSDPGGRWEQAFIRVQAIEGDAISGIISSHLQLVRSFTAGQSYTFNEADLVDWVITKPDGSEEGNVVGKFLDTYTP